MAEMLAGRKVKPVPILSRSLNRVEQMIVEVEAIVIPAQAGIQGKQP
jgi:hypothetical protein